MTTANPSNLPVSPKQEVQRIESVSIKPCLPLTLKEMMSFHKVSASAIERILGIPRTTLHQWLTGEATPTNTSPKFMMLCKFFGTTQEYMLWGIGCEFSADRTASEIRAVTMLDDVFSKYHYLFALPEKTKIQTFISTYKKISEEAA